MKVHLLLRPPSSSFQSLTLAYAVATVLVVRLFLYLSGYPKVGNGTLHIAHLLWGGLIMLLAGQLSLNFYGEGIRRTSAILLGVGFGLFIDEVGKFITQNNDYFFRPAAALIYVTFIVLYLASRALRRYVPVSDQALMAYAAEQLAEVVRGDFEPREKAGALHALDQVIASPSPYYDVARLLRGVIAGHETKVPHTPNALLRRWGGIRARFIADPRYESWLLQLLTATRLFGLLRLAIQAGIVLDWISGLHLLPSSAVPGQTQESERILYGLQALFSVVAAGYLLYGIWEERRNTTLALHMIARGLFISLVFVDVFTFYFNQFSASIDVLLNALSLTLVQQLAAYFPATHQAASAPHVDTGAEAALIATASPET